MIKSDSILGNVIITSSGSGYEYTMWNIMFLLADHHYPLHNQFIQDVSDYMYVFYDF